MAIEGRLASYEATVSGQRLQASLSPGLRIGDVDYLDREPEIRSMMGGTLDDKRQINPTFSGWCSSGQW